MPKKYYNFETMYNSLKDDLCEFLKQSNIYFEVSDCSDGILPCYHFEVLLSEKEVSIVNNWIDENRIDSLDYI